MPLLKEKARSIISSKILVILAVGALLRITSIQWGLPYAYHPDERLLVARGVHFFTGDLNPHLFIYPSLQMELIFIANALTFFGGYLTGHYRSVGEFTSLYRSDPTIFYIVDRLLTVCFALVAIYMTFRIARRLFGETAGWMSALLLAVLPVHVLHSHYVTTDIPCTAFLLISFYYSLRILDSDALRAYLLAGVFGGLAAGTKYNAGLVVLMIPVAHWIKIGLSCQGNFRSKIQSLIRCTLDKKIVIALGLSVLVYLVSTPYTLLDFKTFLQDFLFQASVQRRGHGLIFIGVGNKIAHHLFVNVRYWGGPLFAMLIFAGLVAAIIKINKYRLLILSWLGIYFLAMISSNDLFIRYTLPLVPFAVIFAADFSVNVFKTAARPYRYGFGAFFILCLVYMFAYTGAIVKKLAEPDVRTVAKEWIERQVPAQQTIGLLESTSGMKHRDDPPIREDSYRIISEKDLPTLLAKTPDWLVVTSFDINDFLRLKDRFDFTKENYLAIVRLLNGESSYELVKKYDPTPCLFGHKFLGEFPVHDMMYNFPVILIFKKIN